jgi:hypothetical protein
VSAEDKRPTDHPDTIRQHHHDHRSPPLTTDVRRYRPTLLADIWWRRVSGVELPTTRLRASVLVTITLAPPGHRVRAARDGRARRRPRRPCRTKLTFGDQRTGDLHSLVSARDRETSCSEFSREECPLCPLCFNAERAGGHSRPRRGTRGTLVDGGVFQPSDGQGRASATAHGWRCRRPVFAG